MVPGSLKDKDVIPSFSEIPSILTTIRHPRRRAVSIGPQSEADAYETLAYREKRRRDSISERNHNPSGEAASTSPEFQCLVILFSPLLNSKQMSDLLLPRDPLNLRRMSK